MLALSAQGVFESAPTRPPLSVLVAILVPVLSFFLAYRVVPAVRAYTLAIDLRLLTAMQAWRVLGGMFLALYAYGLLPAAFAWPAGAGDMGVGAAAVLVLRAALATLDEDDLIRIRDGFVDLAYPFSISPTPFVVHIGGGRGERYACCAIDALGMAPMLGRSLPIRSQRHHCAMPLKLSVDPSGPGRDAAGVMVWVGRRVEDDRRACDSH